MKIAIVGYSGAGKSTLARELGERYALPVWHFDRVQFLPNWQVRDLEEKQRLTAEFMDTHDAWVMEGNYSKLYFDRRMEEADEIVFLNFSRWSCLRRAYGRYRRYRNQSRPDMAEGCKEKFDLEFAKWILWKGRTSEVRARYRALKQRFGDKLTVIKNQRQLDEYRKARPGKA